MRLDRGWERPARQYEQVYRRSCSPSKGPPRQPGARSARAIHEVTDGDADER